MKILQVNKFYYPHTGGIETIIQTLSEGFNTSDEVNVLVCQQKGRGTCETVNGVCVKRSGSFGTYFSCPVSAEFISDFRKLSENSDIIHIHTPFPLADLACILSGYKGKVVVSWHSDIIKQKKLLPLYKPLMYKLLKRADSIIAATESHIRYSEYLTEFQDKCKVIPYGIDVSEYAHIKNKNILTVRNKSSVKILFAGRLVYYKGVDILLKAFSKLNNCELFIVGTGTLEKQLKDIAADLNISEKVHFKGRLSDEDLKSAFLECDIFVLPSVERSEAFGLVQLEAMICGKPVVNTALKTGVPYVSLDGITGFTVSPSNTDMLADALQSLADNPDLRNSFGQNGKKRVIRCFTAEKMLKDTYSHYIHLLS